MRTKWVAIVLSTFLFGITSASATSITVTGGTADFSFTTSGLTLTLTDTYSPTNQISKELTGIVFTLNANLSSLGALSVTPISVVDCHENSFPCPGYSATSPYGWGLSQASPGIYSLMAGGGSYKPYAIVNSNYVAPGGNGGVSNNQHNPLLIGPVIFSFSFNGLQTAPDVTSATFYFGTAPATVTGTPGNPTGGGQIPEPTSLLLLGSGLLSLGVLARKRAK
jgi:hypothetical protein